MKKFKLIIVIIIIIILLSLMIPYLYLNYVNRFGNYTERGLSENTMVDTETYNAFKNINTILESEIYGTLILKENGKFYYFPSENNLFETNNTTIISYYEGYWYIPRRYIRFTITNKVYKIKKAKTSHIDFERFFKVEYLEYEKFFNIDYYTFKPIDNEYTKNEPNKLHLSNKIINDFLKYKNKDKK